MRRLPLACLCFFFFACRGTACPTVYDSDGGVQGFRREQVYFTPACGSPGDPVTLTFEFGCEYCFPGEKQTRVQFHPAVEAPSSVGLGNRSLATVVPEGAVTGPIVVEDGIGSNIYYDSPASFVVPCPDAGVDAGTDAGTGSGLDAGTANTDPQDLDVTHGDPTVDIVRSQSFVTMGKPWIRVTFAGAWPRPPYYSHYVKVLLKVAPSTNSATHTDQLHSGVASTMTTGIAANLITFVAEPNGFRILFNDASLMFDSYSIETGVLKTQGGTFVQDLSGPFPFERTEAPFP